MASHSKLQSITERNVQTIAKMEAASVNGRSTGERIADLVAKWVGSWTFLIVQSVLLLSWMTLNFAGWWIKWDPYPFVLLNLVLSFQAAFATPIILMSENRQARVSERRNHLDLQINLLAEQENTEQLRLLRLLCEKAGIETLRPEEEALEQDTNPDEIIRQIIESVEVTQQQAGA
ncbi:MAG: hypothetical protein JWN70_5804 [Planctomycetaceae bacterium]|nr:hypothetical protein [Planctomycetaceae bacterium]